MAAILMTSLLGPDAEPKMGELVQIVTYDLTLVNVYVALPVFTRIAGTSYAYFLE